MTMLTHPDQSVCSIRKPTGIAYPLPQKAIIGITEISPKFDTQDACTAKFSSSFSSIDRCVLPGLKPLIVSNEGLSRSMTDYLSRPKFKSLPPEYAKECYSREVTLEKNRFEVEEATHTNYDENRVRSDFSGVKKDLTASGTALVGPPEFSYSSHLRGYNDARNLEDLNSSDVSDLPDYNILRGSCVGLSNETVPKVIPQPSLPATENVNMPSNSSDLVKSKFSLHETPIDHVKTTTVVLDRFKGNYVYMRSEAGSAVDTGNVRGVEYTATAPGIVANMQNTDLAAGQELATMTDSTDGNKHGRAHSRYNAGQARKPTTSKGPPSKWDDAEKWLISTESPGHPQFRPSHSTNAVIGTQPFLVTTLGDAYQDGVLMRNGGNAVTKTESRRDVHLYSDQVQGFEFQQTNGEYTEKNRSPQHRKSNHQLEESSSLQSVGKSFLVAVQNKLPAKVDGRVNVREDGSVRSIIVSGAGRPRNDAPGRSKQSITDNDLVDFKTILSNDAGESNRNSSKYVEGHFVSFVSDSLMRDKFADRVVQTQRSQGRDTSKGEEFLVQDPKHARPASMKDAATEITPSVSHRDMGTQMTPLGSSRNSTCPTPRKCSSPARHNTPTHFSGSLANMGLDLTEVENCHMAKLKLQDLSGEDQLQSMDRSVSNWSSREEEEEDVGKSLRHYDLEDVRKSVTEARVCAWEEAERSKCIARYQREEAKIQAWVNYREAKADGMLKKLEVKLEKMRSRVTEKIMNSLAAVHSRADDMRAAAEAQKEEQIAKTAKRAEGIRQTGSFPSHCCACFSSRS